MSDDETRRLPIFRSRESLDNGRGELVIDCPRTHRTLSIDECTFCELGDGLHLDRTDRGSYVRCNYFEQSAPQLSGEAELAAPRVSEIMSSPVITVGPSLRVVELVELLLERRISGAPVVDEEQRPIGVVSKTDILRSHRQRSVRDEERTSDAAQDRALQQAVSDLPSTLTVDDVMMPFAFSLPAEASIVRAATLMAYEGVHRVPIVSPAGQVIGLVSALDILEWIAKCQPRWGQR